MPDGRWRHWRPIRTAPVEPHVGDSGQLARVYGFTDLDGSRPDIWRLMAEVREARLDADYQDYR